MGCEHEEVLDDVTSAVPKTKKKSSKSDLKYSALNRSYLFSSALNKIKVQGKTTIPGTPLVLTHKWESGYNPRLAYKRSLDYGCTVDNFLDLTAKGAVQFGSTVTHGNFYTTAKFTQRILELGVKDSRRGPLMVGASVTKNFDSENDAGNVQAAYTLSMANGVQMGVGAKLKFDGAVVKTQASLACIGRDMQSSAVYELEKSACNMHAVLYGPRVCGMKTTFGGLVSTDEQVTNIGLAVQLHKEFFKLRAKVEKLNTASPVPSITLFFQHKPVEEADGTIDLTFSVEKKKSKPCFGFTLCS
ncbi:hypothetical protein DIPPA_57214 [Diplonema papillatum]|nr:hypothetical protein DIPPA_57214 [Diplonema papillatum]